MSAEQLVESWPDPIRNEITGWLQGAIGGHGSLLSKAAQREWKKFLELLPGPQTLLFFSTGASALTRLATDRKRVNAKDRDVGAMRGAQRRASAKVAGTADGVSARRTRVGSR